MLDVLFEALRSLAYLEIMNLAGAVLVLGGIPLAYIIWQLTVSLFDPVPLPARRSVVARELTLTPQQQRSK